MHNCCKGITVFSIKKILRHYSFSSELQSLSSTMMLNNFLISFYDEKKARPCKSNDFRGKKDKSMDKLSFLSKI